MVKQWEVTIPELTGDKARGAYIYLPDSYAYEPERRYPVLYMFDGHNVFFDEHATYGKSWGMKEYMDATETQVIIAAVECNHSPDHGRIKEYSPFSFKDPKLGRIPGLGKKTMDWMVGSFKKEIDAEYRTLPDREHTWISGISMGGPMSVVPALKIRYPIMVLTVPMTISLIPFFRKSRPMQAISPSMTVGLPSTLVIKSIANFI